MDPSFPSSSHHPSPTPTPPRFIPSSSSALPLPLPPHQRTPGSGPPRQGQAASNRNFGNSSAGGVVGTINGFTGVGGGRGGRGGARGGGTRGGGGVTNGTMGRGFKELSGKQKGKMEAWGESYIASEETVRNDYSTHYVQTGSRPQNHLRNASVETRFQEYPKLSLLLKHKHTLLSSPSHSLPPTYSPLSPSTFLSSLSLSSLSSSIKFDSILISPPPHTSYEELKALDLGKIANNPGFVWLWVGNGQRGDDGGVGLEKGRELLSGWGYRRCEDIVWLKTNRNRSIVDHSSPNNDDDDDDKTLFTPTIEHCLMGIRGTVRRSNDPWFVHCNVDTDVIVWEGDEDDPNLKPPELQSLVENFCLGTRRLHLYGSKKSLRRGWVTVGEQVEKMMIQGVRSVEGEEQGEWEVKEWSREGWEEIFGSGNGSEKRIEAVLPFVEELDNLRPKSPPPRNGQPSSGGLGRGRGAGLGITRSQLALGVASTMPSSMNGVGLGAGRGRGRGMGVDSYGGATATMVNGYGSSQQQQQQQQHFVGNAYLQQQQQHPFYPQQSNTQPSYYPIHLQPTNNNGFAHPPPSNSSSQTPSSFVTNGFAHQYQHQQMSLYYQQQQQQQQQQQNFYLATQQQQLQWTNGAGGGGGAGGQQWNGGYPIGGGGGGGGGLSGYHGNGHYGQFIGGTVDGGNNEVDHHERLMDAVTREGY